MTVIPMVTYTGLLVTQISGLDPISRDRPTHVCTWLSIDIGFGRVHQWVGNGPITLILNILLSERKTTEARVNNFNGFNYYVKRTYKHFFMSYVDYTYL